MSQENEEVLDDEDTGVEVEIESTEPEKEEAAARVQVENENESGGDDELENYSSKVQNRIKKLTEKYRKEERDREEAVRMAQQLLSENTNLKTRMQNLDKGYLAEYGTRLDTQIAAAKKLYREAYDGGDTEKMLEAQESLSKMSIEQERLRLAKQRSDRTPPPQQEVPQQQMAPQQQPQPFYSDSEINDIRQKLRNGELEEAEVELDVTDTHNPFMTIFGAGGTEEVNLQDMMSQMPGFKGRTKRRRLKVPDALEVLKQQEAQKLIDHDKVQRDAVQRTEQAGIVFLDEIDKVGSDRRIGGPDVSREGVQRDLLPIVEGSTVGTKYGSVKTDHILFIAAGAFHVSKVADLIPELQGRFPIRVELDSLEKGDFIRILTEPKNALTKQYEALMATEGIEVVFEPDAVEELAGYAEEANRRSENIGARRLYTIMEALLEELSYDASERAQSKFIVDVAYVKATLDPILSNEDLAKYIL